MFILLPLFIISMFGSCKKTEGTDISTSESGADTTTATKTSAPAASTIISQATKTTTASRTESSSDITGITDTVKSTEDAENTEDEPTETDQAVESVKMDLGGITLKYLTPENLDFPRGEDDATARSYAIYTLIKEAEEKYNF